MGLFGDIISEGEKIGGTLLSDLGISSNVEAAIVANIKHDVGVLGGDAESLVAGDFRAVGTLVVTTAKQVFANAPTGMSFLDKVAMTAGNLAGAEWAAVSPAIPGLLGGTIQTLAHIGAAMAIAAL